MADRRTEEPFYIREFAGTKLPTYTSNIMPSLSAPTFVASRDAADNRELDCALVVRFNGIIRAYPLWIMDNLHIVNDSFDGSPLTVIHCERCSSAVAYHPTVEGQDLRFQVAGIWKMTLFIRDEQTNSIWSHSEGLAVDGPLKGTRLKRHPCYPTTWGRWREQYPETQVLVWPEGLQRHRDARHGHGARDYLGRPGIRAGESLGVAPEHVDDRLPESDLVFGLRHANRERAYPLAAVQRNGGVVNEEVGDDPIVVWSPHLGDPLMGAFSRRLDTGEALTFAVRDGVLVDENTESEWSFDGVAGEGPLAGKRLVPLDGAFLKWHAFSPFHPDTELYQAENDLTEAQLQTDAFANLFRSLRDAGLRLRFVGQPLSALCPNGADAGALLRINDDPFVVYRFRDNVGAEEFCFGATHHVRSGRYVLVSEPESRFADNAQLVPLSADQLAHSSLQQDARLSEAVAASVAGEASSAPGPAASLSHLVEGLKNQGYAIEVEQQLEGRRLPVEALNGFELTVNGDRFLVYRFASSESASAFRTWHGHSLAAGRFALRSDPPGQYDAKGLETLNGRDESIEWSALIGDDAFARALESIVMPVDSSTEGS